jgi:hypothetical protein
VTRWGLDYWDAKRWPGGSIDTAPPGEVLFPQFQTWGIGGGMSGGLVPASPAAMPLVPLRDAFQFRRIGHCLAAILFGLVGAVLGRLLAVRDDRSNP